MESPVAGWPVWFLAGLGGMVGFSGGFMLIRASPRVSSWGATLLLLMVGILGLLVFASEFTEGTLLLTLAPYLLGLILGRLSRPWPPDWSQVRPRPARLKWPPDRP